MENETIFYIFILSILVIILFAVLCIDTGDGITADDPNSTVKKKVE